jgi:hypothetical protein
MIEINLNSIIEVSLLVTFLSVLPWIGVFTVLKLMIHYVENVSYFLENRKVQTLQTKLIQHR